ncbi:acyl-CoA dehydrogenase [Acidocella aquatica]|uniref:Acyl-CoA dehydrogenase n=1 Tax=Acidocella aquatica TaxID=1922313 RepID=A0ABQ6A221_9PROT|nr:acyl-CoA dehydrogenase family protein [Acidocella aquatica]GLR65687.1 acyl-CoA dehydrogenase [Acidocella aquatica]
MEAIFDAWRVRSPFYNETHEEISHLVRRFIQKEVLPNLDHWEATCDTPRELNRKAGEAGITGLGFPEQYGGTSEGIDIFHNLVCAEELALAGAGGIHSVLMTHFVALPPVLAMGSEEMKQRIAPAVLRGEKIMALGITEPSGGSDVARLKTTAVRRGGKYIVNGSKMFISNGMRADYYVVAVRTGGEGMKGISLLLIEKGSPGFTQTKLDKMGWHCSDTAALYFDDVEVPVENLIGPENGGFIKILENFNAERLVAAQSCCGQARVCLTEAAEWAKQRYTFGKRLTEHQVIRVKLADMQRHIDTTQAFVDLCAWRFREGKINAADFALLKVQATRTFERVAREAAQVLGGASYIRGTKTERLYREVRVYAIGGGSEEILLDLAGRQLGYC